MFEGVERILFLKTVDALGELRVSVDLLRLESIEGAAHAAISWIGLEDEGAVDINTFPLAPLDGGLLVSV